MASRRALSMARLAEIMADDSTFGYSQKPPSGRWGPDFDCSSFIYFIAWLVGYPVGIGNGKVRFTGQMTKDFKDAGFQLLPFANVGLGDLEIGDILLNLALHAEVYVGEGQVVGAQSSETGGYVGKSGDQTGSEIVKQPAYIYENDWDYVLRPPIEEEDGPVDDGSSERQQDISTLEETEEGEEDMAYPYSNYTSSMNGSWMPRTGMGANTWTPPMQNGMGAYPQGNVGQMNGYSAAGGYQANPMGYGPQQGYPQAGQNGYAQGGYPQGNGKHLIHVPELNDVRDIHVNPGECVPVFIGDGKYMALKSADQEGFSNLRVFELNECTENMPQHNWMGQPEPQQQQMGSQQPKMQQTQGGMVTREEFDQLKEMIGNVQSAISNSGFPQGNGDGSSSSGSGSQSNQKSQPSNRNTRSS